MLLSQALRYMRRRRYLHVSRDITLEFRQPSEHAAATSAYHGLIPSLCDLPFSTADARYSALQVYVTGRSNLRGYARLTK